MKYEKMTLEQLETMTSEQLTHNINTNNEALEYIGQAKRTVIERYIEAGADSEVMDEVLESWDNKYSQLIDNLRLENEVIAKLLWKRA